MKKTLYFFIGTEAELMKMFRVIQEAKDRGYDCKIISNGQNDLTNSFYLNAVGGTIDIDLTRFMPKEKSPIQYLSWFLRTEKLGKRIMKKEKEKAFGNLIMIVHGDTLSTLMGARIAYSCGIEYMHVESGFRSHNWFSPFPEEFDRFFASKNAVINFCPKREAAEYAEKTFKGRAIDTKYNTGIEILINAINQIEKGKIPRPISERYFLTAIHRQENLMNEKFMKNTLESIFEISKSMKCVFIYHEQTETAIRKFGLWDMFERNTDIIKIPRQDYVSFINYVLNCEFVMADGCGNQQEMFYLGKPYLIMRTAVEKDSEGLGENALCFEGDYSKVSNFVKNYKSFRRERIIPEKLPSTIIMDAIDQYIDSIK